MQGATGVQGASTFVALSDTPASYTGAAGRVPSVNSTVDALEFDDTLNIDASNGRVGVGTSSPETLLHVEQGSNAGCAGRFYGNSWTYLDIRARTNDAVLMLYDDSDFWAIQHDDSNSNALDFRYNNTQKVTLKTSGAVRFLPIATPSTAQEGDVYMDSTTHKLRCYDGSSWNDLW